MIYVAEFETRKFWFRAVHTTEAGARDALADGWDRHARNYPTATITRDEVLDSARITAYKPGECTMDGDKI